MFASPHRSSGLSVGLILAAIAAAIALAAFVAGGGLRRVDIALAGGNPFASPVVHEHRDQIYPESPLAVALRVEATFAEVDADGALALADAIARDLGFWLLAHTGASDLHEAEIALWQQGDPDPLAVAWAVRMQAANVRARREGQRLSADVPADPGPASPVYVHPDDLPWMFLHAAWRLDLAAELVRSPIHQYVVLHQPDGDGARAVEPTALWRVDALGDMVTSDEISVGLFLTMHESQFRRGSGGITNPDPLPAGSYQTIGAHELEADLFERLAQRHDSGEEALAARLGQSPAIAVALWEVLMNQGLAALADDDLAGVRRAHDKLADLLADRPDEVSGPDHLVLAAALADPGGREARTLLREVFAAHEPEGPVTLVRSDAHAAAMWMDLRDGRVVPEDYNRRIIPLMNRHRADPKALAELCDHARSALAQTQQRLTDLMPTCDDVTAQRP